MNAFTLRSIVNVETLQEIQERFSDVTGLGVIIADDQGVPVTSPTNFTNFCKHMRSSQEGMRCCVWSDKRWDRLRLNKQSQASIIAILV